MGSEKIRVQGLGLECASKLVDLCPATKNDEAVVDIDSATRRYRQYVISSSFYYRLLAKCSSSDVVINRDV